MEKIGDFARRCQTTIKTLRYYDQLGLLVPDYIDNFTNYRYYGPGKVEEMRQITELKDIGFTLDEIKRYCNSTLDEQTRIIEKKHWALAKLADETAQQLVKLESIKLCMLKGESKVTINVNVPFENDECVLGCWEFVATVPKKEDFTPGDEHRNETRFEELYFLPEGKEYWGFGWTKGFLRVTFGDALMLPYELNKIKGQTFMFIDYPGYGGCWVLRQVDNKTYTKTGIGQWDDINLPFVDDPAVHGVWTSIDFVSEIDDFIPDKQKAPHLCLWLKSMEFLPGGQVREQFGDEAACAMELQKSIPRSTWTKGKLLATRDGGTLAPAYIIREINGLDYMFFEWKSGDVIWGKRRPQYYVLERNSE